MDAQTVARVMSLIPERVAFAPGGSPVLQDRSGCRYPERIDFLSARAHWLAPLDPITKDHQRLLGLVSSNGRPLHASGVEVEIEPEIPEAGTEIAEELEEEAGLAAGTTRDAGDGGDELRGLHGL